MKEYIVVVFLRIRFSVLSAAFDSIKKVDLSRVKFSSVVANYSSESLLGSVSMLFDKGRPTLPVMDFLSELSTEASLENEVSIDALPNGVRIVLIPAEEPLSLELHPSSLATWS